MSSTNLDYRPRDRRLRRRRSAGKVVTELEAMHGAPCKVGIGTPGAISQVTGLMKNSNSVARMASL